MLILDVILHSHSGFKTGMLLILFLHSLCRMSEAAMMDAVNKGPVAIYWTSTYNWMAYGGGMYDTM